MGSMLLFFYNLALEQAGDIWNDSNICNYVLKYVN